MVTIPCENCGADINTRDSFPHQFSCKECSSQMSYPAEASSDTTGKDSSGHAGAATKTIDQEGAMRKNSEGRTLLAAKDYEGAVSAFTEAIDLHPRVLVGAYQRRADAYTALGKLEKAQADRDKIASTTSSKRVTGTPAGRRNYKATEDTVGTGRYVLSFILAGPLGLGIQYLLRKHGWAATLINVVIFVLVFGISASGGG